MNSIIINVRINPDKKLKINFFVNPEDKKFIPNEFFGMICAWQEVQEGQYIEMEYEFI